MCEWRKSSLAASVLVLCGAVFWTLSGCDSQHDRQTRDVIAWAEKNGLRIDDWQAGEIADNFDWQAWVAEGRRKPYAEDVLQQLLEKGDPRIEAVLVVRGLGAVGTGKSIPLLAKQTTNERSLMRSEAIHSLQEIGDPKAVPVLVDRLFSDEGFDNRRAAAAALAKIGDPRGIQAMEEAIEALQEEQERIRDEEKAIEAALRELREKAKVSQE